MIIKGNQRKSKLIPASLYKVVKKVRTLPNDPGSATLFFLTPVELEAVVHLALLVEGGLLHLHLTDALLFNLECLESKEKGVEMKKREWR